MISKQLSITKFLGWRVGQFDISSAMSIIKSSSMIYSGYKLKLFMKWYIIYNNWHRKFPYIAPLSESFYYGLQNNSVARPNNSKPNNISVSSSDC